MSRPGSDPSPGSSSQGSNTKGGSETVVQPGPTSCQDSSGKDVACSNPDLGVWSNTDQCYWKLADPQKAPPPGKTVSDGAWYQCAGNPTSSNDPFQRVGIASSTQVWLDKPPAGVTQMTPGLAAVELLKRFVFQPIPIGIVPKPDAGSKGSVGLPVWLWVQGPSQQNFGPWAQSATIGGVAISGTAKVTSIDWDLGDGSTITCFSQGTPYQESFGVTPSPDCGHIYSRMSTDQPGGKYTVTARANWTFTWQAAGQTGTNTTSVQSQTQIAIGEMQTVIIS
ncbi:hypothetical protein SPF06_21510 [Sinomonas sp. JGH33]|uniref:ATP/GTP-binding protein n=1 Tax=Sinomonas terricola TaxID=3110330 RepID=A0ABU5TCA9_9MICC|nr:hypothetical protein [Sinomonas sp. JGH33]MEA5457303.1 hypothetical protein [Sinomonas sp. JGH33]